MSVSWATEEVTVAGRRLARESRRGLETPMDLLNDELDLEDLWLLEKLFCCGGSKRRLNMVAESDRSGCSRRKETEKGARVKYWSQWA